MIESTELRDVAAVQRLLTRANYAPGPEDGRIGPRTAAAIAAFVAETAAPPPLTPATAALLTAADWTTDPAGWSQAKRLRSLDPAFRVTVAALLADLARAGYRPTIASAWRSIARQADLVRLGRSTVRFSFHIATTAGRPAALAADLIDARWAWRMPDGAGFFAALGDAAKARGLFWGGDWTGFPDVAHVQLLPNARLAAVRRASGRVDAETSAA